MTDYNSLYNALRSYISKLEVNFISKHLPVNFAALPQSYDLDVRAYCVLSHAAFEQFVEQVCDGLAKDACDAWFHYSHCSQPLLALMAFSETRLKIERDEAMPEKRFYDRIRLASEDARIKLSQLTTEDNHGVSKKYLRPMLLPVGINVPEDVVWTASLANLANIRGECAHKFHLQKTTSPEDARNYVSDCMKMLAKIRDDARNALYRPEKGADHFI
jgi:hypothetical protein